VRSDSQTIDEHLQTDLQISMSLVEFKHGCIYIYILLDTVLATDVNKYSLAFARCQPIWRTEFGKRDLFLAVAKDCGMPTSLNQSQQSTSPCFG